MQMKSIEDDKLRIYHKALSTLSLKPKNTLLFQIFLKANETWNQNNYNLQRYVELY